MATTDFLVHDKADNVGVVVVETVEAGAALTGLIMETGEQVTVTALDAIPLGHKVAMSDLSVGDTVLKYGHDIGKVVADVKRGGHVHTQNLKTKRW
jgi:(2R)-sulfolactate sulfo-lyase subunit alpha